MKFWHVELKEKTIQKKVFDLILSFDDVITQGHRESVTMNQLESYLDMDSTDERMAKKMELIKINEGKDIMRKKQKEIARKKVEGPDGSSIASAGTASAADGAASKA